MRAMSTARALLLVAAFASPSFGGTVKGDPEPCREALVKHIDAKLKGELVDKALERKLAIEKLAAGGVDGTLLRDLVAQQDLAAKLTKAVKPERPESLAGKVEADARLAELKAKALAAGVEQEALDRLLDPPSPIQVTIEEFIEFTPRHPKAEAKVRVSVTEGDKTAEGTWDVSFEFKGTKWTVTDIRIPPPAFGAVNYSVLFVYLVAMLAIGWWTSRRIDGTRGFFIANGRLGYFVVGVSILTAYMSALTMMGLPGVAFGKRDMLFAIQLPFLLLTAFIITRFVLRRYRDAGVISVYEFLEQRIHVSSRLMASFCFILFSVGRMGLVLFLPALAFSIVTGSDLVTTIVVMGLVVTVYTMMGGIEAVIWTDFVQAFVMLAGAAVSLMYVLMGTWGSFAEVASAHHKLRIVKPGMDITGLLTLWLILETIVQTVRIYGTQQDITQRYMTTPSTKEANRSVWIAICGFIPLGFLFLFIGSALFVFYKVNPDPTVAGLIVNGRADSIYPYFVASTLPMGLAGLVIAAIFAAAMSSIDACMNASSTVCVEDFYRRFKPGLDDEHHLVVARGLTLVWGLLATGMALLFINITTVQIVWGKIMGISTNGVLGLMALAFLPRRVNRWAAGIGFVVSYLCLFAMMWYIQIKPGFAFTFPKVKTGTGISYLLWPVVGNLVCFGVALLLDKVMGGGKAPAGEPEPTEG